MMIRSTTTENPAMECQRHLFDVPRDVAYFNCAAFSPLPNAVRQAGEKALMRKVHPWTMDRPAFTVEADCARGLFGQLINASGDDIAIVPATSYGIAVAAANLTVEEGQSIVVVEAQFPSNYHVWKEVAEEHGAHLVVVPAPEDGDWTPRLLEAIDGDTAVAALPNCHWTDGSLIDLEAVGARCRQVGAALVLDTTQTIGVQPFDVARVQPDYMVCSAYKWLLCPYTLAFLYVAPHRQDGRPLEYHYGQRSGARTQYGETGYAEALLGNAQRFDMGERYNFVNLPMACVALEQIEAWGVESISAALGCMTDAIADKARNRGFGVLPRRNSVRHIVGIRVPGGFGTDLPARLAGDGVFVSPRGDAIRISPYLYNDAPDVERLFDALKRHL
jgi:selenocysteine lyase/cysteine desulfurase